MENRLEKINRLIKTGIRTSANYKNKELYNCDVCWTCRSFNVQTHECLISPEYVDKKAPDYSLDNREMEYYVPTLIKSPSWYRCMLWEEKSDK